MATALSVVIFRVGRIDLVVVGRSGRQTGNRQLMVRDHRRINWRTFSVGSGGSIVNRGVSRDVGCPNDLRASGCDRTRLDVRNIQSPGRGGVGAVNKAGAAT